ncbi:MAG: hypothetical protein CMJ49_05400 [Planctomycetaceae bacterium]|nr:hypothetical protein [Planctomycetaceae bacterium]
MDTRPAACVMTADSMRGIHLKLVNVMIRKQQSSRVASGTYRVPLIVIGLGMLAWSPLGCDQTPVTPPKSEQVSHTETVDENRTPPPSNDHIEFLRQMNVAKAHLENGKYAEAIEGFTQALVQRPGSGPADRNLARALIFSGESDAAIERLDSIQSREPDSAAAAYLIGVAFNRQSKFDRAIPHFEHAARLDASTAAIRYQLAQAYDAAGRPDDAVAQLRQAVRLDPQHTAAQYRLAMHARTSGDMEEYRQRIRNFARLRDLYGDPMGTPLALEACVHTKAEPAMSDRLADRRAPTQQIQVQFVDATKQAFAGSTDGTAATFAILELDDHGQYTFFVVGRDNSLSLMVMSPTGAFERKAIDARLPDGFDPQQCIVGNFIDRAADPQAGDDAPVRFADVLVVGKRGVRLLQRVGAVEFQDVTRGSGLTGLTGNAARWVDYEYDGDLDLAVAGDRGLEVWQNNGDGRFQQVTSDVGIAEAPNGHDISAIDLDSNGGVDLIMARGATPTLVYENQRAGLFAAMSDPPGPWPAARRVLANDLNNDGEPDVLLVGNDKATILFGRSAVRQQLDQSGLDLADGVLFDYDNDGWLDFCGVGRNPTEPDAGAIKVWRNGGADSWTEVTTELGMDGLTMSAAQQVIAADIDADGDSDLLVRTVHGRLRFIRNMGGHVNGQLKLRLVSAVISHGGVGAHVEIRNGDYWVARSVPQSCPIEIGLQGHAALDSVQTVWTDGTVDSRVNVTPTKDPMTIVVFKKTLTGSCPYLFAWDGSRFRFVTDLVGSGATGLSLARNVLWQPDPYEIVSIGDGDQFPPVDGQFTINVTSELREVAYFDHLRLIAVDHPRSWEIHPTDKFMLPPFADSQLWALDNPIPLARATDHEGRDQTDVLRAVDGEFTPPGKPLPPPARGMCEPASIALDFRSIDTSRPLVLALTGWLAFGDASSNIALSQDPTAHVVWPTLEVQTSDGQWTVVDVNVGMPAGKTKTILCDLSDKLPHGASRLRLTTTFEIHWDRVALFERRDLDTSQIHELAFDRARLDWRGFSDLAFRDPGHPMTPDFDDVSDQPPWRTTLEGWCTRYGDVRELIAQDDGMIVILNGGDAMTLSSPAAALPSLPQDLVRSFFLSSVGWNREDNANTVGGDRVQPLPREPTMSGAQDNDPMTDWRVRYNTRWVPRDQFDPGRKTGHEDLQQTLPQGVLALP